MLDVRGEVLATEPRYQAYPERYRQAHIPGAVFCDWRHDFTDPASDVPVTVASPEQLRRRGDPARHRRRRRRWSPTTPTSRCSPAASPGCCGATATAPHTCWTAGWRRGARPACRSRRVTWSRRPPTHPTRCRSAWRGSIDLAGRPRPDRRRRADRRRAVDRAVHRRRDARPAGRSHPGRAQRSLHRPAGRRRPLPGRRRSSQRGCGRRASPSTSRSSPTATAGSRRRRSATAATARGRSACRGLRRFLERVGEPRRHPDRALRYVCTHICLHKPASVRFRHCAGVRRWP